MPGALRGQPPAGGQIDVVDDAELAHQPGPDLRLRERAVSRLEQTVAEVKGVVRELQIEERRLAFPELAGRRQHVVGQSCGLAISENLLW